MSEPAQTIEVPTEAAGQRLDVYLTSRLKNLSRSKIQKLIKGGEILLDGRHATPHEAVAAGQKITIAADALTTVDSRLKSRPDIDLRVVYEDDDVAVIDKPSGLLVHPGPRGEQDTLANALIARWPAMAEVGEAPERPGIVHRLDKDASGLMVVAKNQKAYRALKRQFQNHKTRKQYAVLVIGRPPRDEGTIELAVGRSTAGGKMAARRVPLAGDRTAVTHYRITELFRDAALLEVRTETGRTHQIRTHFRALGCPVAGDPLYGRHRGPQPPTSRLFLHAAQLEFNQPTNRRRLKFESPLPPELQKTLSLMRLKA